MDRLSLEGTSPVADYASGERLLELLMDFGEMMLQSGAEIGRVEGTLSRLARAFGAVPDVYVIVFSIVVTLRFPGKAREEGLAGCGMSITQTRRVDDRDSIDFTKLDRLNDLSRRCCAKPMPLDRLSAELAKIREGREPVRYALFGNMLGAFSFSIFFGGSIADGLAAALLSVLIVFIQNSLGKYSVNRILNTMVVSAIAGTGIGILCRIMPYLSRPMVMIGDIMLLSPGVTMINAVREMMVGNTLSGEIRLIESTTWALALAAGFMLAIHMTV